MRVMTKSIKNKLPMSLIEDIWDFYDEGYTQTDNQKTILKMWQEIPPVFKIKPIPHFEECEVWVINDGILETMMFTEEC